MRGNRTFKSLGSLRAFRTVFPRFVLAVSITCFFLTKSNTPASVVPASVSVSLRDSLLNLQEEDFVTGERFAEFGDVAFFKREYVDDYPSVRLHTKHLVFVDEPIDETIKEVVGSGKVFFIKPDWLDSFIKDFLPLVNHEFVLLTHMSDLGAGTMEALLTNSKMRRWYGCNMRPTIKTKSVPLGLENVDMWQRTNVTQLVRARTNRKSKMLYVYFNINSNIRIRTEAVKQLNGNGFKMQKRDEWSEYIDELSRYKFCASPEGNGIDTHRMWECLYLGVIPIVIKTPELYSWYSDLPILWITSFEQVTRNFLENVVYTKDKLGTKTSIFSVSSIKSSLSEELTENDNSGYSGVKGVRRT